MMTKISMGFVRATNLSETIILMHTWLSLNIVIVWWTGRPIYDVRSSHNSSLLASEADTCYTYVDAQETIMCFPLVQAIILSPSWNTKPVVVFLSVLLPAQSASTKQIISAPHIDEGRNLLSIVVAR